MALNPTYRIFFKLCQKLRIFMLFLAGHTVAMVIYYVTKNDNNVHVHHLALGSFFDTMIVESTGLYRPIKISNLVHRAFVTLVQPF